LLSQELKYEEQLLYSSNRVKRNQESGQCCSCGRGQVGNIGLPGEPGEDGKRNFEELKKTQINKNRKYKNSGNTQNFSGK